MNDNDEARRQKLLHAYDQERQDERAYWSTAATIMLTALTLLVAAALTAKSVPWAVWIVVPFAAFAIGAYNVQQSAIGARRRWYMEALEIELSRNEEPLLIDKEEMPVRIMLNNRYTWSLASLGKEKDESAGPWAIGIFVANIISPILLVSGVVGLSIYRIVDSGHTVVASIIGIVLIILLFFLFWSMLVLTDAGSRDASWKLGPPSGDPNSASEIVYSALAAAKDVEGDSRKQLVEVLHRLLERVVKIE